MTTYAEKLKHPLWQRKRLEILERDKFACRNCGDTETTLHVHHVRYRNGHDPWDYRRSELITLCEICHDEEHQFSQSAERSFIDSFRALGATANDLIFIAMGIDGPLMDRQLSADDFQKLAKLIEEFVGAYGKS